MTGAGSTFTIQIIGHGRRGQRIVEFQTLPAADSVGQIARLQIFVEIPRFLIGIVRVKGSSPDEGRRAGSGTLFLFFHDGGGVFRE